MANYKRKHTKEHTVSLCGRKHCKYDLVKLHTNGRDRYLPLHWKKFEGNRPWRYIHKNV
jgi:hypothetical protein